MLWLIIYILFTCFLVVYNTSMVIIQELYEVKNGRVFRIQSIVISFFLSFIPILNIIGFVCSTLDTLDCVCIGGFWNTINEKVTNYLKELKCFKS